RGKHDRRAVGVVGADVVHGPAGHPPRAHPDVGLHVSHQVAEVQGAVGVGQGIGDEGWAGHGAFGWEGRGLSHAALVAPGRGRPGWAGPSRDRGAGRSLGLALPELGLAEEGDAAGGLEPCAVLDQFHLGPVDLALVRLEHGAAGPRPAVRLHAADDLHAGDRLVLAVVLALVAGRVGPARIDELDDPATEDAVRGPGDLDDR